MDKIISQVEKNSKFYTKRSLSKELNDHGNFQFIEPSEEILQDVKGIKLLGALNKSPS
jgi:hypothetical protein